MSIEHLLIPRVRCIGHEGHHFPNSPFAAGEILEVHQDGARLISIKNGRYIDWLKYKRYPHLFAEIFWYEEREASEMPPYIKRVRFQGNSDKSIEIGEVIKVKWAKSSPKIEGFEKVEFLCFFVQNNYEGHNPHYDENCFEPATESEFKTQTQEQ